MKIPVVIVGGGIAGLSAAWRLDKRGFRDFVLLEMHGQAGGNARWGENEITAYPWAAHYVPVPGKTTALVRELFEELGVLRNGVWDDRYLCFSPQERLFLHGRWQEGIEPAVGSTARDREDFSRFGDCIRQFRATGEFTIPMDLGAKPSQIVRKVLVPLALPDIYNSLRHLFGLAFGYIMLAELINAQHGLGYLLMTSQRRGMSEHIILILMIIGVLAFGIDRLLFWFQRGLFPYRVVED